MLPSAGVCPSWETDDVNPAQKRKIEYRKMKAAFEWNDWPVPSPQSFHHWTLARQVDHLVTAHKSEPDLGFMARLMALCSLPRTNPGRRKEYVRRNGPYTLVMTAGYNKRLPYGNLPRLLLAWITTEAVRTQRRELILGRSLSEFMRKLGITSTSGGTWGIRTRLRNQMDRLFNAHIQFRREDEHGQQFIHSAIADRGELWWNPRRPEAPVLWDSKILLGETLFNEIIRHPIPLDMNILRALKRSPLGLDLYMWLTYRTFTLKEVTALSWKDLYRQFGVDPERASDRYVVKDFRKDSLREMKKIKKAWPDLRYGTVRGALIISPSKPPIPPATQ